MSINYKIFIMIKNSSLSDIENEIFEFKKSNNQFICSMNRKQFEDKYPDIYDKYCKIEEAYFLKFKNRPDVIPIALNKEQIEYLKTSVDYPRENWSNNISFQLKQWNLKQKYKTDSEYWKAPSISLKEHISIINNYSLKALLDAEKFSKQLYKFIKSIKR